MAEGKKRNWGELIVGLISLPFVGAIIGGIITNPRDIMAGIRALPGEVRKTSDELWGWYHADSSWTGYWTNNPQGYADAEDMNLSNENMALDLVVNQGVIDGTISTKLICGATPFNEFFLVRGNVSGSKSAEIVVWDIFQGHKADIAMLEVKRDGVVITVVPKEGAVKLFPKEARLALDSSRPGSIEAGRGEFCEGKAEAVTKALRKIANEHSANHIEKR